MVTRNSSEPPRPTRVNRAPAAPFQWVGVRMPGPRCLLVLLLVAILCGPGARAEDAEDLSELGFRELAEIIRTRPPTPELTAALVAREGKAWIALGSAASSCREAEALNVVEHAIRLGWLSRRIWISCCRMLECDVVFVGVVRRILHPGVHGWWVDLDVREVLRDSLALTAENTPMRIGVRASGGHSGPEMRWVTNTWEAGTELVFCASHGRFIFEGPLRTYRGLHAWGGNVWEPTGREKEVLQLAAPLAERDPTRLLAGMRSDGETTRWLSTAAAILMCRDLGAPFAKWHEGSLGRRYLAELHAEVLAAFEEVQAELVWDSEARALRRRASPEEE